MTRKKREDRDGNPPTIKVKLTFAMFQAAEDEGSFVFKEGEWKDKGLVVEHLDDGALIEGRPLEFLDLVQTYVDLIDVDIANRASWAAIKRISGAALDWMQS